MLLLDRIDPVHRLARPISAAVFACASLLATETRAAVTYYFNWYCPGCSRLGSAVNGREGPFGSQSACDAARASMSGSLSMRGCGADCFNPQLCRAEGAPDVLPAPRQPPGIAPPSIQIPTAPSYDAGGTRRAEEVRREREEAEREAQSRSGTETPSAANPALAANWRNAYSRYEVHGSGNAIEIVLVDTCATPECSRRTYPNRTVFRGRFEGGRLIGVVRIHAAVETAKGGSDCPAPSGEFPIEGKLSGDGRRIFWGNAEFPARQGCRTPSLSLGAWKREP